MHFNLIDEVHIDNRSLSVGQFFEQHMPITCPSHGHHMTSTWPSHGHHMNSTWTAHDHHMDITWPAHDQHMTSMCVLLTMSGSFQCPGPATGISSSWWFPYQSTMSTTLFHESYNTINIIWTVNVCCSHHITTFAWKSRLSSFDYGVIKPYTATVISKDAWHWWYELNGSLVHGHWLMGPCI